MSESFDDLLDSEDDVDSEVDDETFHDAFILDPGAAFAQYGCGRKSHPIIDLLGRSEHNFPGPTVLLDSPIAWDAAKNGKGLRHFMHASELILLAWLYFHHVLPLPLVYRSCVLVAGASANLEKAHPSLLKRAVALWTECRYNKLILITGAHSHWVALSWIRVEKRVCLLLFDSLYGHLDCVWDDYEECIEQVQLALNIRHVQRLAIKYTITERQYVMFGCGDLRSDYTCGARAVCGAVTAALLDTSILTQLSTSVTDLDYQHASAGRSLDRQQMRCLQQFGEQHTVDVANCRHLLACDYISNVLSLDHVLHALIAQLVEACNIQDIVQTPVARNSIEFGHPHSLQIASLRPSLRKRKRNGNGATRRPYGQLTLKIGDDHTCTFGGTGQCRRSARAKAICVLFDQYPWLIAYRFSCCDKPAHDALEDVRTQRLQLLTNRELMLHPDKHDQWIAAFQKAVVE